MKRKRERLILMDYWPVIVSTFIGIYVGIVAGKFFFELYSTIITTNVMAMVAAGLLGGFICWGAICISAVIIFLIKGLIKFLFSKIILIVKKLFY